MNSSSVNALLASGIPDPTDFPQHSVAPGLRQLDMSFRCSICSELFEAPVTLPCGHCFCSICIRDAIGEKQECPSCRKPGNEGHLRTNPVMEEAVTAWKSARPLVLRLSKEEEHRSKRPQQRSERSTRKRKRSSSSSASGQDILVVAGPSNSRTGPGVSKVPCGITNSPPEVVEIESDDDALEVPTSDPEEESTGNDIVDCPLCSRRVELRTINKHMDQGCRPGSEVTKVTDRRSNTKNIWSTILGTGAKGKERKELSDLDPLPRTTYAVLKDRQIKDLLSEHGLPLLGDRKMLVARHERWVILYNANLDRSPAQRQSLSELRKSLKSWESEMSGRGKGKGKGQPIDVHEYQRSNKAQFAQLVEAARPTKQAGPGSAPPLSVTKHQDTDIDHDDIVADSEEEEPLQ